jgi:hypothetical protein
MHRVAVLATYAAMLPLTPGFILVPFVIWARVLLGRNTIRAAFDFNCSKNQPQDSRERPFASARRYVSGRATGLIVSGVINIAFAVYSLAIMAAQGGLVFVQGSRDASIVLAQVPIAPVGINVVWSVVAFMVGVLTLIGALHLRRFELFHLVIAATVAAMLPLTPGCLIGFPCGIWALAVLRNPEVRAAFDSHRDESQSPPPASPSRL